MCTLGAAEQTPERPSPVISHRLVGHATNIGPWVLRTHTRVIRPAEIRWDSMVIHHQVDHRAVHARAAQVMVARHAVAPSKP